MTVCIAAKANGGKSLVLVADQMATTGLGTETESAHKILQIKEKIYLLTGGNEFPAREIYNRVIERKADIGSVEDAVKIIDEEYKRARLREVEDNYLQPRGLTVSDFIDKQRILDNTIVSMIDQQIMQHQFSCSLIVAGMNPGSNGMAKIYEFASPGVHGEHGIFAAIGSGGSHATNSLHARKYVLDQSADEASYLVFEAKKRSEVAQGVGPKTEMIVLSRQPTKVYSDDELKTLNDVYESLIEAEKQLLTDKLNATREE